MLVSCIRSNIGNSFKIDRKNFKMIEIPTIPEFYLNKNIFITGGSGFIGKVLVEKLLRSCPDLKCIYLLMREKKGQIPLDRIKTITDLPLFDVLKSQDPDSLNKIKIVVGDVGELDLGLNLQERQLLIDEVNIVFHVAASIRFNDSLTDAVIMNVRGTREVAKLALQMKNLNVFIHISTTYCNTNQKVIEERLYPANEDWVSAIEIAENIDRHTLNVMTEKYVHPQPNTYVFAKALGEHVVHDMCDGKIPTVIYRPSIVVHTNLEPIPGWIDNFNGPVGFLTGIAKGLIRTFYCDPNSITDYVPVDITAKAIIISSWKQATYKDANQKLAVSFYNGSNNNKIATTLGNMVAMSTKLQWETPFNDILWYSNARVTKCYYNYFIQMIFFHLLPALLIDGLLKLLGRKPMLVKIQRKIHVSVLALAYFTHNHWTILNDKMYNLKNELLSEDLDKFSYKDEQTDLCEFYKQAIVGARKYLLNEGEDFEKAKEHTRKMWILAQVVNVLWYLGLFWILIVRVDIVSTIIKNLLTWIYIYK